MRLARLVPVVDSLCFEDGVLLARLNKVPGDPAVVSDLTAAVVGLGAVLAYGGPTNGDESQER